MPRLLIIGILQCLPLVAGAQWTNRYPKNVGFNHQVYLEGFELPTLGNGPVDPAPSPDGRRVVVASRGWLWSLDLVTERATRLTSGAGVDSRPAWSRDGRLLAFVRDDGRTTAVVVRDLTTGSEREIDRGMALDPVFTADGSAVIYSNLPPGGDLDLWRFELASGQRSQLTRSAGLELRPQLFQDGSRMVYSSKTRAGGDEVRVRQLKEGGAESTLLAGNVVSQTRPALSHNGAILAYGWPGAAGWELRIMSVERPTAPVLLMAKPRGRPVTPAWSSDDRWIYFSEADTQQRFRLYRINANGGEAAEVQIRSWDYVAPTGRIVIKTNGPSRLSVRDASGHPLVPDQGMVRFDGQNGLVYFYSNGVIELEAAVGPIRVMAVRGLTTPVASASTTVGAGTVGEVSLNVSEVWNPAEHGWFSGDHHFHLNYGGQVDLQPEDLVGPMRGEALDVGTPMLANLHNRFENQDQWAFRSVSRPPMIAFAQEVRSHFLGHVGLIGTSELFWPWTWGPGYEVRGRDDRLNAEPLVEARRQGGLGVYVHPVFWKAPFSEPGISSIPIALVPDAVHGAIDLLELVCLWSNEIGTTELWYRLLNAGFPVMPSGGTDAMTDLHRTMAVGSARVYVQPQGLLTWRSYLSALKAGHSFVTTGPMVEFTIGGARPGDVLATGAREVPFSLRVHTAMPIDSISVVVNGRAVWAGVVETAPYSREYTGKVRLPAGGWVAARVVGPPVDRWPAMASRTFAHTAPVWIGSRGSTEATARRSASQDLLRVLANAENRLDAGYAGSPIPLLKAHFASARSRLTLLAQ